MPLFSLLLTFSLSYIITGTMNKIKLHIRVVAATGTTAAGFPTAPTFPPHPTCLPSSITSITSSLTHPSSPPPNLPTWAPAPPLPLPQPQPPAHDVPQLLQVGGCEVPVAAVTPLHVFLNAVEVHCVQVQEFRLWAGGGQRGH